MTADGADGGSAENGAPEPIDVAEPVPLVAASAEAAQAPVATQLTSIPESIWESIGPRSMGTMPPPVGAQVPRPRMQPVAPPPPLQAAQPRISTAPRAVSLPPPRPSGAAKPAAASPFRRLDDRLGAALDAGGDGGSIGGRAHRCCLCVRDRHQPGPGGRAGLEVVDPRATVGTTRASLPPRGGATRSGPEIRCGASLAGSTGPRKSGDASTCGIATSCPTRSRSAWVRC